MAIGKGQKKAAGWCFFIISVCRLVLLWNLLPRVQFNSLENSLFGELQDRWHSLLYDPVVSVEALSHIIEFERSVSTLSSKFGRTGSSKDSKSFPGKIKSECT
ncbi:hypothetical protein PTKIN_Ptkin09bG0113100 [Pterospermum kingtungense]